MLYPECGRRVLEVVDRVVGQDRRPTQTDIELLIYLQVAWKEDIR